eukprot:TRINITY_DN77382_c0_g1_i1.p1 TRINITY_DN77382_c0_g1~~TRINITY_DN77382_c0_g1_i1.p1  ORF type:complete len:532 (+),score=112.39 TRINITY_DN77382_c0_g1_i1:141-1736(+)
MSCSLLRLACADIRHALARPCRRGRGRSLPARALRRLLFRCGLVSAVALLIVLAVVLSCGDQLWNEEQVGAPWLVVPLRFGTSKTGSRDVKFDAKLSKEAAAVAPEELTETSNTAEEEGGGEGTELKSDMNEESMRAQSASDVPLSRTASESEQLQRTDPKPVVFSKEGTHVCFCSDDKDLRPLAVAINSTLTGAKRPQSVIFHLVTSAQQAPAFENALRTVLPALTDGQLNVHHDSELQARIKGLVTFRSSSGARKSLSSPFNFAPFYLDEFLAGGSKAMLPERLVYLDTDVVLEGDIEDLSRVDLGGKPVAAVEDCSQQFDLYIDFKELKKLGFEKAGVGEKDCVFNRGVFVMDVEQWRNLKITPEIERWMTRYRESKKDLYKYGLSQPPWLLALHGRYKRLGAEWNCRGLGREFLNSKELSELKTQLGLDFKALQKVGARAAGQQMKPYLASCSLNSKLLHFNGAMKPWRQEKWDKTQRAPLCAVVPGAYKAAKRKSTQGHDFMRCADRWSYFLSDSAAESLKHVVPP